MNAKIVIKNTKILHLNLYFQLELQIPQDLFLFLFPSKMLSSLWV